MGHHQKTQTIQGIPERIHLALIPLLEAVEYAEQTSGDVWEFAVELERLTALKLNFNDFRWLVRYGLVEHQREVTRESDDGRAFRRTGDLTFPDRTCFILTDKGIAAARQVVARSHLDTAGLARLSGAYDCVGCASNGRQITFHQASDGNGPSTRPKWDAARRSLSINGVPVKHFKWTAENQEAVLSAFEEEDWPPRIDDPLPPHPDQDSKRRLSDTIKCLNRKQSHTLIHFRGDGTGEGIIWELVELPGGDLSDGDGPIS